MKLFKGIALSMFFALAACGTDADVDTTASGAATYKDSATDQQGQPKEAAKPAPQSMSVSIIVEGSGNLSGLEPECSVEGLAGSFEGLFQGDASVDGDGLYVASLASSEAELTTPSGCEIPTIEITALGEVKVRATISATSTNCQSYCEAKARSEAEAQCGSDAGSASCRAAAEGQYTSSCTTSCTSTTHVIVAESKLSAQALAELNARSLTGAALGDLQVDLTFDRIEDANGSTVSEN